MALDMLASRERQIQLFERYGPLLTEHQRQVLGLYLGSDWSLSEIARTKETSRAAVHDLVRRAGQSLEEYERRLGLIAAEQRRRTLNAGLAQGLADVRRRLARLEQEMARA